MHAIATQGRPARRPATLLVLLLAASLGCSGPAAHPRPGAGGAPTAVAPPADGRLFIAAAGNRLVDGSGATVTMRGVNISGLEFVAAQGWSPDDPWGGAAPDYAAIAGWHANTVRIPLNSASWLGINGADPGHNYQATVRKAVGLAHAAGLYVILDLHWDAPGGAKPLAQSPMAYRDHALHFWKSVATAFRGDGATVFDLFNEPYDYWWKGDAIQGIYRGGVSESQYVTGDGSHYTASGTFAVADMQAMLKAVRDTGATNLVLVGGHDWASGMDAWLDKRPSDPARNLGASWHPYPGQPQATSYPQDRRSVPAILQAGFPVVATETGDHNAVGTRGAPFLSVLLPWLDQLGVGYLGWTWDAWGALDNILIKDASGTPTDGYGVYFHDHLKRSAAEPH